MDTIDTNEPTVVEDVTTPADTSSSDTQPTETENANVAESAEEGKSETLLAGKYKSAEELEKAYTEIQKVNGQLSQKAELANILESQTGMNAQQIRDYIAQQENARYQQEIEQNPLGYIAQEVQGLKSELALKDELSELGSFISKNPEYADFKDDILDIGLNLKRDMSYEDIAHKYFGQARAKGQQDAYNKIESKKSTQTSKVSSGAPKQKLTLDDLRGMSADEQAAVLPHTQG